MISRMQEFKRAIKNKEQKRTSDEPKVGTEGVRIIQKMPIHFIFFHFKKQLSRRDMSYIVLSRIKQ